MAKNGKKMAKIVKMAKIQVKSQCALCSRNFQNVKLRLDLVEIWQFYVKSNFGKFKQSIMAFFEILDVLKFNFGQFEKFFKSQIDQNSNLWVSKIAKNDIFGPNELTKIWFHAKS